MPPEDFIFSVYPLKSGMKGFLDSESKESHSLSIYLSISVKKNGLRIQEPLCWKKMLDTFSEEEKSRKLDSIKVIKEDGTSERVNVIASLSLL